MWLWSPNSDRQHSQHQISVPLKHANLLQSFDWHKLERNNSSVSRSAKHAENTSASDWVSIKPINLKKLTHTGKVSYMEFWRLAECLTVMSQSLTVLSFKASCVSFLSSNQVVSLKPSIYLSANLNSWVSFLSLTVTIRVIFVPFTLTSCLIARQLCL